MQQDECAYRDLQPDTKEKQIIMTITNEMKQHFLQVMRELRGKDGVEYEINEQYIDITDADIERFPELREFSEAYIDVISWQIQF